MSEFSKKLDAKMRKSREEKFLLHRVHSEHSPKPRVFWIGVIASLSLMFALSAYGAVTVFNNFESKKSYEAEQAKNKETQSKLIADSQQKALGDAQFEIEKLKIANTEKPKTAVVIKSSPPPRVSLAVRPPVLPTVVATANPSALCVPAQNNWENFVRAVYGVDSKVVKLVNKLSELTLGTGNRPTDAKAATAYSYTLISSGKDSFLSQVADARSAVDALPKPETASDHDMIAFKTAYYSLLKSLEISLESSLQAYKISADNPYGLTQSQLDTHNALLRDSIDASAKYSPQTNLLQGIVVVFRQRLENTLPTGCYFTFFDGTNMIKTTTKEELNFTTIKPTVEISKDYPPSSAKVFLKTTLPTEISENGSSKITMKFGCTEGSRRNILTNENDDFSVAKIDINTAVAIVSPISGRSFVTRQCSFTYTGNGALIASEPVEVRI